MFSARTRPLAILATFSFLLLIPAAAHAQRITVARIDTSTHPEMRALVYLLDSTGRALSGLSPGEITIRENGTRSEVLRVNCPSPSTTGDVSSVLTIDVSGSMSSPGGGGATPNIALARAAARAWVDALPDGSECAITAFDSYSLINQDFTGDRSLLYTAIDKLRPNGGTNYNAGLTGNPAGGITMVKEGSGRRVVVFLTDGRGDGNEEAIISAAQGAGATIFCVTLGMRAPDVLKNIAHRTGGQCYENVTTIEEARTIYHAILYQALGGQPCEIVWRSEAACNVQRELAIAVESRGLSGSFSYQAPRTSIPTLVLEPPGLAFGIVPPGERKELTITMTAAALAITVERIEAVGAPGPFTLEMPPLPFTLAPGERRSVTVRYGPTDTNYRFARWIIRSNACFTPSITAAGGAGAPAVPTIRLTAPNGGERFVAGEETTLRWEGVLPGDTVRLEYSTNNGASWQTAVERAAGGSAPWTVPATPSERCLARVAQLAPRTANDSNAIVLTGHQDYVMATNFSRDGSRAVTASWDGTAKIWDARNGRMLSSLVVSTSRNGGRPNRVYYAEFSPDGKLVLTAADGNQTGIWDAGSGRLLHTLNGKLFTKPDVEGARMDGDVTPDAAFSADGAHVLLRSDNIPAVWDVRNGRKVATLAGHTGWVNAATFSPDGRLVVTGSRDSTTRVWDAATGRQIAAFTGHREDVWSVTFSPDGRWVASTGNDGYVRVWDAQTGQESQAIKPSRRAPETDPRRNGRQPPPEQRLRNIRALFSPDGTSLLIWAGVEIPPIMYDLATGGEIRRLEESPNATRSSVGFALHSPDGGRIAVREANVAVWDAGTAKVLWEFPWDMQMSYLAFSPDGTRLAASNGRRVNLWSTGARTTQSDVSDSLWAIIDAQASASDVDFGPHPVRAAVDSVITGFIANTGSAPLHVASIALSGSNAKDFALVSGPPPFEVAPGARRSVEFRFTPSSAGARNATIEIQAGGRRLRQSIKGRGITPPVTLAARDVRMGDVPIGDTHDSTVTALLKNSGGTPVEIRSVRLTGPDTTQFFVDEPAGGFTLAAGESRAVTVRFAPVRKGRTSSQLVFVHDGGRLTADLHGRGVGEDGPGKDYTDPTTFRTIAVPNAVVPPAGSIVAGVYDLAGVMVGYVPVEHVMILGGGAIPFPDDWGGVNGTMYGAYSLGVKAGFALNERMNIAAGYQWARSIYDQEVTPDSLESGIVAHTPYAAFSYGNDNSRISLTAGYAFKTHTAVGVGDFTKNAAVIGMGGDYRFARRWKIAAEALYMQSLGFAPVAVTARFFGERFAIDAGLGYLGITTGDGDAPSLKIAPVVSYVARW